MSNWVIKGLTTGVKTTSYPRTTELAPGVTPGRPIATTLSPTDTETAIECCPTGSLLRSDHGVVVDYPRCVHCYRCARELSHPVGWEQSYEWAGLGDGKSPLKGSFESSIHIVVVDAGDCGACLNEVKQLNNPYYNMHRLGFFITPSPRHADVMLVVGAVTDHMRFALEKTYEAMPAPKKVIAVGACALSGGIFADSFVCAKGLSEIMPIDVEVPGNPPPPLAILHGLLVAVGRKSPASLVSSSPDSSLQ